MENKVCSKCKQAKPLTEYYFSYNKPSSSCKKCISVYQKEYYKGNSKRVRDRILKYYNQHKERVLDSQRKYRINNIEHVRDYQRNYQREYTRRRYQTDTNFRLLRILRARLNQAVNNKTTNTLDLLGCSLYDLKKHLSSTVSSSFCWNTDYDSKLYHIDHIIPCAFYNLTDPEQQRRCFHYSNLQLIPAQANLQKGGSLSSILPINLLD